VVWNERLKGADEVTVRLGRAYPTAKVYDPTVGTHPIQIRDKVDRLTLSLLDHPVIIAIAPN
jgi:hypothetical protein